MSRIFLVGRQEEFTELVQRPYDSEGLLQQLIAKYPGVLAGDQVDPASPRRWVLVSREVSVPGDESGSHRWRLDHLFLDQDAVPTLVEVKRSTDPRLRREVIGQMLDYAANGVAYWPVERLKADFEQRCQNDAIDPDEALAELIGESDPESFWRSAKANLQAGRIRLVFVADEIPAEVRRIVEFLNQQMDQTEVLAIEIQNYVSADGLRTLVPRVIGQTEQAQQRKSGAQRPSLTLEQFLGTMTDSVRRIYKRMRGNLEPHIGVKVREKVYTKTSSYWRLSDNKFLLWLTPEADTLRLGLPPNFVRDRSLVVGTTDAGNSIVAVRTDTEAQVVEEWLKEYLRQKGL